jgi:hypothetical protein
MRVTVHRFLIPRETDIMGGFEGDTHSRKNLVFLRYKGNFSPGIDTEEVTFTTRPYSLHGEMMSAASYPPGNDCGDIPGKKKENGHYPGRSVLYSQPIRPFDYDHQHGTCKKRTPGDP